MLHHRERAKMEQPYHQIPAILLITDREGECHGLSRMHSGEY
jgi:hypothetical protein